MFDHLPTSTGVRNAAGPLRTFAPARTVAVEAQGGGDMDMDMDMETRVLLNLLSAFPGFSLEDIAQAYTESDSDVNAAADLLATRQPGGRSNGLPESWKHSAKMDGFSRRSVEQQGVKSDHDLLLEKYGRGVGERINQRQSDSRLHNGLSGQDGASQNAFHFNSRTALAHNLRGDNRVTRDEVLNKEDNHGQGVSADGALLVGRKKTKQKGRGGLDNGVEMDSKRQADEEFLLSMLGENSELGIGVVRDILDGFKGDVQQSLEVLLHMSSSTCPRAHIVDSTIDQDGSYVDDKNLCDRGHSYHQRTESRVDEVLMQTSVEYQKFPEGLRSGSNLLPKAGNIVNGYPHQRLVKDKTDHEKVNVSLKQLKECFPHVHDSDLFHALQSSNFVLSDAVQVLLDAAANQNLKGSPNVNLGIGANTVESSYAVHKDAIARPPPLKAAWTDVKRTITPLNHWTDVKGGLPVQTSSGKNGPCGDSDDYGRRRLGAHEQWRMMDYYFKEANAAYNRGERARAATLAEKGKEHKQLAQEADGRASQRLFQSRNKGIVNNVTIDLHAQHVNEAMNVLKRHLKTLCSVPSVHMLTVITGYGSHSVNGRAKIKPAVTDFLARSGIPWEELNEGCLTVKMMDARNIEFDISDG